MTTEQAIRWAGGTQQLLADRLGIFQSAVSHWGEYPPALRQLQIERLSRGRLRAEASLFKKASRVPA